jgi:hypothetical protein
MDLSPSDEAQEGAVCATSAPVRTTIRLERVKLTAVVRLLGGLRGWLDEEIQSIRVAQMDDAFFATTKGVQYRPMIADADDRPAAF